MLTKGKISRKTIIMIGLLVCFVFFTIAFFSYAVYQRNYYSNLYDGVKDDIYNANYEDAEDKLNQLENYKDADELRKEVKYFKAIKDIKNGDYTNAINMLTSIVDYKDSEAWISEAKYQMAISSLEQKDYVNAKKLFTEIGDYKESSLYLAQIEIKTVDESKRIIYDEAIRLFESEEYKKSKDLFESISDYQNSDYYINECTAQLKRRNLQNVISAGVRSSVAIRSDGTVIGVGDSTEMLIGIQNMKDIVSLDAYGQLAIGITKDGKAKIAGKYGSDYPKLWENVIDVASGQQFVIALHEDGTVEGYGHNGDNQRDVSNWKNVIAIDAGWSFSVGLTENHDLLFAGNDHGQIEQYEKDTSEWKDVVNISAGGGGSGYRGSGHTVGLKSNGTVVAIGDNSFGQCDVSEWKNIVKVAAGDWYTVGLQTDGSILITGENSTDNSYIDEQVIEELREVVDISAGYGQTICLLSNGKVVAFGFNDADKCRGTQEWNDIMQLDY